MKLNGEVIGEAPLRIRNLPEGEHRVEINAPPGFYNKTQSVAVTQGEAPRVEVELEAMNVVGRFESVPPGAAAFLVADGERKAIGKTPASAEIDPRKSYEVVFEKSGYSPLRLPLGLEGAPNVELSATLVPLERGRPAAAERAPAESDRPPSPAPVEEREPRPSVAAAAEPGILRLGAKPPCRIFVDGRDTGETTPQPRLELEPGRHRITLVNDELGLKESFIVKIKAGETTVAIKDYMDLVEK